MQAKLTVFRSTIAGLFNSKAGGPFGRIADSFNDCLARVKGNSKDSGDSISMTSLFSRDTTPDTTSAPVTPSRTACMAGMTLGSLVNFLTSIIGYTLISLNTDSSSPTPVNSTNHSAPAPTPTLNLTQPHIDPQPLNLPPILKASTLKDLGFNISKNMSLEQLAAMADKLNAMIVHPVTELSPASLPLEINNLPSSTPAAPTPTPDTIYALAYILLSTTMLCTSVALFAQFSSKAPKPMLCQPKQIVITLTSLLISLIPCALYIAQLATEEQTT